MSLKYCKRPYIVKARERDESQTRVPMYSDPSELSLRYSRYLFEDYEFIARYSFDYDKKEIHLYLASLKFRFKFLAAQAFLNSAPLPAQLSNAFDFNDKSQCVVIISFHGVFIDLFGSWTKVIGVGLELKIFTKPRKKIWPNFLLPLPHVMQLEMEMDQMQQQLPDTNLPTVQDMYRHEFDRSRMGSKERDLLSRLDRFKKDKLEDRYRKHGYANMLNVFLDIEDCVELELLQKFSMDNVVLEPIEDSRNRFLVRTPHEVSKFSSSVKLIPMEIYNPSIETPETQQIRATIREHSEKHIVIEIAQFFITRRSEGIFFEFGENYRFELAPNLFISTMAKRAINRIISHGFEEYMLNFTTDKSLARASSSDSLEEEEDDEEADEDEKEEEENSTETFREFQDADFQWFNTQISTNHSQMSAIKSIVSRTSFPSPFVVFGGPGCGKTSLAVEAVAQIVKLLPKAKVLVTTYSNSACDEIGDRLLNYMGPNQIYRFYSPNSAHRKDVLSKKLVPLSNIRYKDYKPPSYEEIGSYNVVLSSVVNSGRLSAISSHHFDFIFVDECASVAEAFACIPISLVVPDLKASIILLGDPKQLGQTVKCFHTERYGLNASMMERIMKLERYKFKKTGYDPNYIVQLTENFRSHKAIIKFSNEEFYNSQLVARQRETIANFALGWKHLPNKQYPIIFQANWTPCEEKKGCTSMINHGELFLVQKYVNSLLQEGIEGKRVFPSDIGIISPYAAQRELLKNALGEKLEIGSVEYFQGREKLIIIFSCVRSKTKTVGFLKNEKRLNVALTRAKALQIVIGNPETLGKNKFWRRFITLCHYKEAVIGKVPVWVIKKTKEELKFEDDNDVMVRLEEIMNGMIVND